MIIKSLFSFSKRELRSVHNKTWTKNIDVDARKQEPAVVYFLR